MIRMAPRRLLALLVLTCGGLLYAETPATVAVPPAPKMPAFSLRLDDEDIAVLEKWYAEHKAWEEKLTPEQKASQQSSIKYRESTMDMMKAARLPRSTDGYSWQQAAEQRKLDAHIIEQLSRDKIAYGKSVNQSFEPYRESPVFITSDSLLNGFHVLFEDTFHEYELRQVPELRKNLETVLTQIRENLKKSPFPPTDTAPGWRLAQIVVGPALALLGTPLDFFDADVRDEIQAQVSKIKTAAVGELPAWLGAPTNELPFLDYRFCKPVGFYAADPKLTDYFRAVRWLQMVPFRADRDVELAAIGLLGYGADQKWQLGEYFRTYSALLGPTDNPGLPEASSDFSNLLRNHTDETWASKMRRSEGWLLRHDLTDDERKRLLSENKLPPKAQELLAKIQFKIIPGYLLPDTVLFQKTVDAQHEPEGLLVAAMLGSSYARNHLKQVTPAQFDSAMAESFPKPLRGEPEREPSLYDEYLNVLRAQFVPPANDAPAFMRSEAWQAKSCQAALSGWSQMRHSFTLQSVISIRSGGISIDTPGFVEPNPEFFSRLADLVETTRRLLNGKRERWDALAATARRLEALSHKQLRQQPWTRTEVDFITHYDGSLAYIMGLIGPVPNDAPRWAEVYRNQPKDYGLAVGVGRPRIIYVLYPWNGMEILCQGSVMSYYEYHSKERLTDAEWKQLLDSPQAPAQPDWLQPYLAK
jgi:hypothetical protein